MPQFRPAVAKPPKSRLQVPFRERAVVKPENPDKGNKQEPLLWARRLPYKLVQGSHVGHGIRMEPSRKEPPDWKEPKKRLKFNADGELAPEDPSDKENPPIPRPVAIKPGLPAAAKAGNKENQPRQGGGGGGAAGKPKGLGAGGGGVGKGLGQGGLFNKQGGLFDKKGGVAPLQPRHNAANNAANNKPGRPAAQQQAAGGGAGGGNKAAPRRASVGGGGFGATRPAANKAVKPKVVAVAPAAAAVAVEAVAPAAAAPSVAAPAASSSAAPAAAASSLTTAAATAAAAAAAAAAGETSTPPARAANDAERAEAAMTLLGMRYATSTATSTAAAADDLVCTGDVTDAVTDAATSAAAVASAANSSSDSSGSASDPSGSSPPVDAEALRTSLQNRQLEVEYLLRPSLSSSLALDAARQSVTSAIAFNDELARLGAEHEMSKGRLFQALLEELRDAGADHAQMDNSSKKGDRTDYRTEFGADKWAGLAASADALRNLVRVKVADDNDLRTARAGLVICNDFFEGLSQLASLRGMADAFAVFEEMATLSA